MTVNQRLVTIVEWALVILLSIELFVLLIDLSSAWNAQPCSSHSNQGCYPWGGEGPVAGLWHYASKRNYVASSIFAVLLSSVTLLGAFVVSRRYRIFVLLAGIVLFYTGGFLLPYVI